MQADHHLTHRCQALLFHEVGLGLVEPPIRPLQLLRLREEVRVGPLETGRGLPNRLERSEPSEGAVGEKKASH